MWRLFLLVVYRFVWKFLMPNHFLIMVWTAFITNEQSFGKNVTVCLIFSWVCWSRNIGLIKTNNSNQVLYLDWTQQVDMKSKFGHRSKLFIFTYKGKLPPAPSIPTPGPPLSKPLPSATILPVTLTLKLVAILNMVTSVGGVLISRVPSTYKASKFITPKMNYAFVSIKISSIKMFLNIIKNHKQFIGSQALQHL